MLLTEVTSPPMSVAIPLAPSRKSYPLPPVIVSLPVPPMTRVLPEPTMIVSVPLSVGSIDEALETTPEVSWTTPSWPRMTLLPGPPVTVLFPAPARISSVPGPAVMVSLPPMPGSMLVAYTGRPWRTWTRPSWPRIRSLPPPVIVSLPALPRMMLLTGPPRITSLPPTPGFVVTIWTRRPAPSWTTPELPMMTLLRRAPVI